MPLPIRHLLVVCVLLVIDQPTASADRPNVLLIAIDDLNDWVGCLNGHPQAITPHIDALAARGVLFTNAHCNAPICNPSRVSLMTGIRPSTSGIYLNHHDFRAPASKVKDAITLPRYLATQGYSTMACGKLFHASRHRDEFQEYGPAGGQGPFPNGKLNVPASVTKSRAWDWGVFPEEEPDCNDVIDAEWTSEKLADSQDRPFLLACGFYRPHVPWFAPQRFHDLHPVGKVTLPAVREDDRDDIPAFALQLTDNPLPPRHNWFVHSGKWKQAISSYLAAISFADDNVGKVVSALDAGPHANSTWIVLFSDHGFFLGEKQRWAKQSLWERATKVPLMVVPPKNDDRWKTAVGQRCDQPVELLSIFPTLVDVCGLKDRPDQVEGHSLVPLLKNAQADWPHTAVTSHAGNNHAVRGHRYRYIRYDDGSEELYDLQQDPAEWANLAGRLESREIIARLGKDIPQQVAENRQRQNSRALKPRVDSR